ncbi:PilZ domain-containing protein [Ketobacter sp.]|uniref:PilZ domain-containing protein n=1 Tax=Ketobacter sp. TaxID=2083498 RepID=UPI000F20007B|nr:PilZ domain-containing protein [Ketobacter sp.]MEE2732742.1 PilZ domain-containing protein [Pseudomonadota bacterium]RLU01461.1 MAG: PilZ domain-containing protein [Ketobacter sp.]
MERRDFYRIEDRVHLIKTPIERHLLSDDPYSDIYHIPRQALLVSQLQSIDNESRELLRQVGDSNRALGSYLRYLEEKIDLIAKYLVSHDKQISQKESVNLSEGGISFYHANELPLDSYLHVIMVLFPSYATIASIGIVKSCEKIEEQPSIYRVGVEFEVLLEPDRKQIVRHIRRLQSREIRDQSHTSNENN